MTLRWCGLGIGGRALVEEFGGKGLFTLPSFDDSTAKV
jgi:hypothetical protein